MSPGNTNTLAGNVPPKADLGDLRGLASGIDGRIAPMINGGDFDGAKAYKDSKVPPRSPEPHTPPPHEFPVQGCVTEALHRDIAAHPSREVVDGCRR